MLYLRIWRSRTRNFLTNRAFTGVPYRHNGSHFKCMVRSFSVLSHEFCFFPQYFWGTSQTPDTFVFVVLPYFALFLYSVVRTIHCCFLRHRSGGVWITLFLMSKIRFSFWVTHEIVRVSLPHSVFCQKAYGTVTIHYPGLAPSGDSWCPRHRFLSYLFGD